MSKQAQLVSAEKSAVGISAISKPKKKYLGLVLVDEHNYCIMQKMGHVKSLFQGDQALLKECPQARQLLLQYV